MFMASISISVTDSGRRKPECKVLSWRLENSCIPTNLKNSLSTMDHGIDPGT